MTPSQSAHRENTHKENIAPPQAEHDVARVTRLSERSDAPSFRHEDPNALPEWQARRVAVPSSTTRAIHCVARSVWRRLTHHGFERQDVEQELTLHYLLRCHRFDEARASAGTFATHVCRNRAAQLTQAATATKRGGGIRVESLSTKIAVGEIGHVELGDTISQDVFDIGMRRGSLRTVGDLLLRLDVERIVRSLPLDLAAVARLLLAGDTPGEAARRLGISRSTLHRRVVRLRQVFHQAGLSDGFDRPEAA